MVLIVLFLWVVISFLPCDVCEEVWLYSTSLFITVIIFLFNTFDFKLTVYVELALGTISAMLYGIATAVAVYTALYFHISTDYIFIHFWMHTTGYRLIALSR